MGRDVLTDADLPVAARERIGTYLAAVVSRLPASVRHRCEPLLAEITDGLFDAFTAHRAAGLSPVRAAEAAVAEFGEPALLARALVPELAAAQARRTTLALVGTGPVVGALWVVALVAVRPTPVGPLGWPPWHGFAGATGTAAALPFPAPFLAPVVTAFLLTAMVVLASTGRPGRWLPNRPRLAPTAAVTATVICVACDLTVLSILTGQIVAAPRPPAWVPLAWPPPAWVPLAVATAASLTRLVLASRAARHCLALRAAVHTAR